MRVNKNRRITIILSGIIVVAMIAGIFFLTFQSPQQTIKLSETVRIWLKNMGWELTPKQIRSYVHIPMFFLLGLTIFFFGRAMRWKWFVSLLFAMSIALVDEGIKVLLPTREFDYKDLLKDYLGIGISGILFIVSLIIKKTETGNRKH